MGMVDAFLGELQQESETTRRFLERVPEDKLGWKAHEKSMTVGQVALHIATIPAGVSSMALEEEASPPNFENGMAQPSSKREIIEAFESSLAEARRNLSSLDDERMVATWRMSLGEGVPALEMPRAAMLRSILLNHLYHHRGQLGVYLRLLGASVPSAYGPSGDEMPDVMGAAAV